MKKFGLILWLLLYASAASAQSPVVPSTSKQASITGTVTTATKIITGVASQSIYVTALLQVPVATSVVTYTTGTGTNCGTGTANITGAMTFATGQVINMGNGYGAIFVVPLGNDLCVTIATAAAPGSISYTIF